MKYRSIRIGDFVQNVAQNTSFAADFDLDLLAGRHVVILFAGTLQSQVALAAIDRLKQLCVFNGKDAVLLVVLCANSDTSAAFKQFNSRGVGVVYDVDCKVSRHFGAAPIEADANADMAYRQIICTLNPRMQVDSILAIEQIDQAEASLAKLADPDLFLGFEVFAPILVIPNVFEAALCNVLIGQYNEDARPITGSMRRSGGQTIGVVDTNHKVRRDHLVQDQGILDAISSRIRTRIKPEIRKIHQFEVTRIERNLVGCYTAEDGGHFRAHRDNTTPATVHRKFALSVNLNDDFDGGEVCFPEYGTRSYRAPAGGAVVFSCSLLHAVTRVKRGARYAYLPFLYDDEGSRIRAANVNSNAGASFAAVPEMSKQDA
jgi:predicted 2-oxoglutarate/Fe(II)-dependent dioxygenase YbiX